MVPNGLNYALFAMVYRSGRSRKIGTLGPLIHSFETSPLKLCLDTVEPQINVQLLFIFHQPIVGQRSLRLLWIWVT